MVMLFAAGFLFATSALAAGGTSLRNDQDPRLREVIPQRTEEVAALADRADELRDEVDRLAERVGGGDSDIVAQNDRAEAAAPAAGLTGVHGPGVMVSLDDAPRGDGLPDGAGVDDVVVHQQDVQAVVNALWSGGAEAMTIMDVRVVSTSAVRCVGNTLLLHGQVYSPPFRIAAIGDPDAMMAALNGSDGVRAFRAAADDFGLGYRVDKLDDIIMPGYDGPIDLIHAGVPQ